jgi:hypothetical protein
MKNTPNHILTRGVVRELLEKSSSYFVVFIGLIGPGIAFVVSAVPRRIDFI